MKSMKKQYLYAIVLIVALAVIPFDCYSFSSQAVFISPKCPRWNCGPSQVLTYTGSKVICTSSSSATITGYHYTQYTVALNSVNNLIGYWSVSWLVGGPFNPYHTETFYLAAAQSKALSDGTVFTVTALSASSATFNLISKYETKSSSLTSPFPKSTGVLLMTSQTTSQYSCPSGYSSSCSASALVCTSPIRYVCGTGQPYAGCTQSGSCSICPT